MRKEFLNPADLPNWKNTFSQVVTVDSGSVRTIYVAGQVSVDKNNEVVGRGDLGTQAEQAFKNLQTALAAAASTTTDVVRMNIYVVGYRPEHASLITEALRTVFPQPNLPASTWLGVESLAIEELLIEVDALAVVELG